MKKMGLRLTDIESTRIHTIKLDPETAALLKTPESEHYSEYIKRYLNDEKLYEKADDEIKELKTAVKNIAKAKCAYCQGKSKDPKDGCCEAYLLEADANVYLAGVTFANLIEQNRRLISEISIKPLTLEFFKCIEQHNGRVSFNLERITMHLLDAGFAELSNRFKESDTLQTLSVINHSIDALAMEELEYKTIRAGEDHYHIAPQKKFFKDKRKFYKEEIFLQKQKKKKPDLEEKIQSKEDQLRELGFFELAKVTAVNKQKLMDQINDASPPYQIAYLDYLGLFSYMQQRLRLSNYKIHRKLSTILEVNERAVKGNWSVLNPNSTENRERYTADKYIKDVENQYKTLK